MYLECCKVVSQTFSKNPLNSLLDVLVGSAKHESGNEKFLQWTKFWNFDIFPDLEIGYIVVNGRH